TTAAFYPLSLHDALPILIETLPEAIPPQRGQISPTTVVPQRGHGAPGELAPHEGQKCALSGSGFLQPVQARASGTTCGMAPRARSEEHTSELQSQSNLVC